MKLFDSTFLGLEKSLDVRFKRHVLLTSNVANSETPNYRARELDFAGSLEKAMGEDQSALVKTDPKHMDVGMSQGEHIVYDNSAPMGSDGNNVDLDITMGKVSANARAYENSVNLLSQKLRIIRSFIRKGAA